MSFLTSSFENDYPKTKVLKITTNEGCIEYRIQNKNISIS